MNNLRDPLDRLRAANPVLLTDPTLGPPDPVQFRRITTGATPGRGAVAPWTDRPRRRARRLVPVLAVSSLLAGATAYGLLRGEVSKPEIVACYGEASLAADTEVVSVDEEGPVAACAELWRRGAFGGPWQAPELAECVLDSGVVAVFPTTSGADVCARLNLPPVAPTTPPATSGSAPTSPPAADLSARVLAFREAVAAPFLQIPCVEPPAAASMVRRELDRAGLADWTVRSGEGASGDGFSPQRPCATLLLQPEAKEVVLVPTPRR